MSNENIKFRVTLNIEFTPHIETKSTIEATIKHALEFLSLEGLLSVDLDAEVESYKYRIEEETEDETPEPEPQGVKVYDLKSDKELHFDANTDPVYAVRYAHVTEDRPELSSWFFAAIQDRKQNEIERKLPVTKTATTVCCGDWATKL